MIIGLTGGIGSGKSTVLRFFEQQGFKTYIADVEAKRLMHEDAELKNQIIDLFGKEAYNQDGLNRPFIAAQVFDNKDLLQKLNSLVHPKVRTDFKLFKSNQPENTSIIYEAAILFESGNHKRCDYIITVVSNLNDRIERVMTRDNASREAIQKRIDKQSSDEDKVRRSHFVIRNNHLDHTQWQVATISEILSKIVKI